jgi:hypothetical protein
MPKFTTTTTTTTTASGAAVSAAILGIACAAFFASAAPPPTAGLQIAPLADQPLAEADRVPVRAKGAACSSRSWPYYDQDCRFDLRAPAKEAQTIRVIDLR